MEAIYADLDQILFEKREKDYGAYVIRSQHSRILMRALLIGLLMFISITALPKIISWMNPPIPIEYCEEDPIVIGPIIDLITPITEPVEPIEVPSLPKGPKVPNVATLTFSVPNPSEDEMLSDDATIHSMDEFDDKAIGLFDTDGELGGNDFPWDEIGDEIGGGDEPFVEPEEEDERSVVGLERMPEPLDLAGFRERVGYPRMAIEGELEGTVKAMVRVDLDGTYLSHEFVPPLAHPILMDAVAKELKNLRFLPAIRKGRPVKFWAMVPVTFKLNK
jgi:protein TonB